MFGDHPKIPAFLIEGKACFNAGHLDLVHLLGAVAVVPENKGSRGFGGNISNSRESVKVYKIADRYDLFFGNTVIGFHSLDQGLAHDNILQDPPVNRRLFDPRDSTMHVVNHWGLGESQEGGDGLQMVLTVDDIGLPFQIAQSRLHMNPFRPQKHHAVSATRCIYPDFMTPVSHGQGRFNGEKL